ncbi:hypothetical protein SAMN05421852_105142 [Thermoflavimicrobium dichotomicum]|uniref:Uncharacterized protein n=1 Tax=Thermoflavimicrobium dichotomicum TaxID=46223 RepID=A0A1I3P8W2_9BACL|nr:hypothetical protein SAMN05421852_105142 [Thermoflavimicrobium dichotomicum]
MNFEPYPAYRLAINEDQDEYERVILSFLYKLTFIWNK